MRFEWNALKATANLGKHGASFDEAASVFFDLLSATGDDPGSFARRKAFRDVWPCKREGDSISGVSLKDVPMAELYAKACFSKNLLDFFSHHDRAVLSTGASKRYREITFPLADVVRQ